MRRFKVGQIVSFNEDGLKGFGIIVRFGHWRDNYLVKLLYDLQGEGHDGDDYDRGSKDYWWVVDSCIDYGLVGNKVVR